jgi:methylthioribose-1-phosphate isomerase
MGIALGMRTARGKNLGARFERLCETFAATRPTAVNLFWAIDRMRGVYAGLKGRSASDVAARLAAEAVAIHDEDIAANRRMGAHGATLIGDGSTVLTHCNAGALATAGFGTALGVIYAAREGRQGRVRHRMRDAAVPAGRAPDRVGAQARRRARHAHHRRHGRVHDVAGPDRLRRRRRRPRRRERRRREQDRHVRARRGGRPSPDPVLRRGADVDGRLRLSSGAHIPIEERAAREVTHLFDRQIAPSGSAWRTRRST